MFAIHGVLTGLGAWVDSLLQLSLQNKRILVGSIMLVLAVGSAFGHQLLFDMYSQPHDVCKVLGSFNCYSQETGTGWCYVSWYWYWDTIRFYVSIIFGSIALVLFVPTKYTLSSIPFSLMQAVGWAYLIHFSFFTYSHETVNAVPSTIVIFIAIALGFAVVMSADALLYWENHKKRGNWQRFVGVTELDIPFEKKEPMYKQLAKEYREIQKMI